MALPFLAERMGQTVDVLHVSCYGEIIGNPKFFQKDEKKLAKAQRRHANMSKKNFCQRYTCLSLIDVLVVLLMGVLLYIGAGWQMFHTNTDAARYQCYAVSFWRGLPALSILPDQQCTFITHPSSDLTVVSQSSLLTGMQQWGLPSGLIQFVASQDVMRPFHALPNEYPGLSMIPFSLGLVVPTPWYQVAFAVWMAAFAGVTYVLLLCWSSRRAALVYAFLIVIGGWATVVGRFDILPALFTLVAVLCAEHKRWGWAFVALALATLLKIYPIILLPVFLLALQREMQGDFLAWHRWRPLILFVLVCIVMTVISFLFSAVGTIAPLNYFGYRPVQAESLAASVLWILKGIGINPSTYVYTFGSLNVNSPFSALISSISTVLFVIGLFYTWWLLWCKKIDLAIATLLSLLIMIVTSKVFSPQYLMWVIPLVAYTGAKKLWYLPVWGLIGFLTSWIYPYIYNMVHKIEAVPDLPLFYPVVTVRNVLLLGFVVVLLLAATRRMIS
jgi:hypothetical protein